MESSRKFHVIVLVASLLSLAVLAVNPGIVYAAEPDIVSSVSVRRFPKQAPRTSLTEETVSTDQESGDWGGIETLNVPQTQSQAEKAAAAKAEADKQAAEQEARERLTEASRSSQREQAEQLPVSQDAAGLVQFALQFQGAPYRFGGNTPDGWDCSGFTQYVFKHFGVDMPHAPSVQPSMGVPVSDPQPGDLMVGPGHAGIYVGNGLMVHAMTPALGTRVTAVMRGMSYYRVLR